METTSNPLAHPVPEACRLLGVGRTMLYQLIERGELRQIKIGAKTLIPDSELRRLISERLAAAARQS